MSKLRSDELVNMEGDGAPSFPQGATTIEPTADNQVATKLYVDSALSAASGNAVSDTAPTDPAVGSFWTDTSVSPSLLKTWNGSMWIEFAGTASAAVGVVVSLPSLSATNLEYAPATITASAAQVSNATLFTAKWYKDDVEIVGATGLTYVATEPGVYRYEERWADDAGNVLTPSLNKTIELLAIQAPSILSPVEGSGLSDFDYTAESSAIANVGTVDALGDDDAFDVKTYTGNSSSQKLTTGLDMSGSGGLFWLKQRNGNGDHWLYDIERGPNSHLRITTDATSNYGDSYNVDFENDGVTLGSNGSINYSGNTYVGWSFLEEPGFFDVVTYTGSGATRTVPHNLGSAPGMIIIKGTNISGSNWAVYHKELDVNDVIFLNYTSQASEDDADRFAGVHPTSTEFTVGTSPDTNYTGSEYVAYVFADNPSNEIKCGTFSNNTGDWGTPAAEDATVDCGFEPQFVIAKLATSPNASTGGGWYIMDSTRGWGSGIYNQSMQTNETNAEAADSNFNFTPTSTGFIVTYSSPGDHIYLAIGSPKVTVSSTQLTLTDTTVSKISDGSLVGGSTIDQVLTVGETVQADTAVSTTSAATVFSTTLYKGNSNSGGSGQTQTVNTGVNLVDGDGLIIFKQRTGSQPWRWHDTIRGIDYALQSHNDGAQFQTDQVSVNSTGFTVGAQFPYNQMSGVDPNNLEKHVAWTFRKAPGFFDIVTWSGNDVQNRAIPHSLGTTPGCIIVKELGTREWYVYHSGSNLPWTGGTTEGDVSGGHDTGTLVLDKTNAFDSSWGIFTYANSTAFGVRRSNSELNYSGGNYVAYVFAEDTPLIKCGTFSSSGETVNLGFRPQWIMMKSVDNTSAYTGNWRIFDTARGIVNGDGDASLYFNEDLPENTNVGAQAIAVNETGFTVEAQGAYGSSTIYVAIAENAQADITSDVYATGTVSSYSGGTVTLSNSSGTWSTGMKVQGTDSDTKDYPDPISPSAVTFTSTEPVTNSGTVSTWDYAEWNLSHDSAFSGVVHQKAVPLTGTGTQAGPDDFPIQAGTEYFVRTKYASSLPTGQSDWSAVTRFLTKANTYVDDLFAVNLYRNDSNTEVFNNGLDMSGEGGLIITKYRDTSSDWAWVDSERSVNKVLKSNNQNPESDESWIQSFDDDGFTHGNYIGTGNNSGVVSWSFRKQPGFFDVVKYSGQGASGNVSIPHNLGTVPGMIIVKSISHATEWYVYHRSLGATKYLRLDSEQQQYDDDSAWHDTEPTDTHFTLGNNVGVSWGGREYIAYLFAHDEANFGTNEDESIIKCGMYTGNGGSKNVEIGFEPQWVLIKNVDEQLSWSAFDNLRGAAQWNSNSIRLRPDNTGGDDISGIGFYSNGISLLNGSSEVNRSGKNFVYVAIRRPHKPVTVATDVFAMDTGSSSTWTPTWDSGFPVDAAFIIHPNANNMNKFISTRLLGSKYINTNDASAEAVDGSQTWDSNVGWGKDYNSNAYSYMFRRAPGFMDVVTYTGDLVNGRTVPHNLGTAPELMLVRKRTGDNWEVYDKVNGATNHMRLDTTMASSPNSYRWNDTEPTSTEFTLGTDGSVNNTAGYVAYLFASLDGVSKVGSYTGTGGNVDVDCGFANGARFILIKRTDTTGDWYFWDTARGITSGNDPYSLFNTYDAQVNGTDYVDPLDAGFTVTSSAPAGVNANGGTYLFLAIA